jgi:hypothetical protein
VKENRLRMVGWGMVLSVSLLVDARKNHILVPALNTRRLNQPCRNVEATIHSDDFSIGRSWVTILRTFPSAPAREASLASEREPR